MRIILATLASLIVMTTGSLAADNPVSLVPASVATLKPVLLEQSRAVIAAMRDKATPADPQYYQSGVWHYANAACPSCQLGPASLAAALYVAGGKQPEYLALANATIDASVHTYQHADGSLGDETTPDPIFMLHEIGFTCDTLRGSLDAQHEAQCVTVMTRGADWIITSGNAKWYANGNIVAMQVAVFAYAWRVTGLTRFLDQYETELRFLVDPPQTGNSVGFGLAYTTGSHATDGSDGAGFLAERGANTTGFDGDYTQLQLSTLARLYVVTRDARLLRICNLLFNSLWVRTNHTTFVTDATGGARHSLKQPLWTGAVASLAWVSGREDALGVLAAQWRVAVLPTFLGNARDNWGSAGLYRDAGIDLGQMLIASMDERLR